jgi:hypothetical protein
MWPRRTRVDHVDEKVPGYAMRLDTSLNGLKQSAFNWNTMAAGFITSQGFTSTVVDPCLYIRRLDGQCLKQKATFEASMEGTFPVKKRSGDHHYLGMQVQHDMVEGVITINHCAYIINMLATYNMSDCNSIITPAAPRSKLQKSSPDKPAEDVGPSVLADTAAFVPHYRGAS